MVRYQESNGGRKKVEEVEEERKRENDVIAER